MLDITSGDPLRAMQIEDRVSEEWWARALVYRASWLASKSKQPGAQRLAFDPPIERQRYELSPDGRLVLAT